MDVTCERCGTEYEFDETLLSGRGTSVKCTNCGHVFKVYPKAAVDADRTTSSWRLKTASGLIDTIDSLRELQRRITSGELTPKDEISRGEEGWKSLGSIPELETFFRAAGVDVPSSRIPSPLPPVPPRESSESSLPPGRRPRQPTLLGVSPIQRAPAPAPVPAESAPEPFVETEAAVESTSEERLEPPLSAEADEQLVGSEELPAEVSASADESDALPDMGPTSAQSSYQSPYTRDSLPGAAPAEEIEDAVFQEQPSASVRTSTPPPAYYDDDDIPELPARATSPLKWLLVIVAVGALALIGSQWERVAQLVGIGADPAIIAAGIAEGDAALAEAHPVAYQAAIAAYQRAVEAGAGNDAEVLAKLSNAYSLAAQAALDDGADAASVETLTDSALEAAESAARMNSRALEAKLATVDALRLNGSIESARERLEEARAMSFSRTAEFYRVDARLSAAEAEGRLENGLRSARQAADLAPEGVRYQLLLARAELASDSPARAKEALDAILKDHPAHPVATALLEGMTVAEEAPVEADAGTPEETRAEGEGEPTEEAPEPEQPSADADPPQKSEPPPAEPPKAAAPEKVEAAPEPAAKTEATSKRTKPKPARTKPEYDEYDRLAQAAGSDAFVDGRPPVLDYESNMKKGREELAAGNYARARAYFDSALEVHPGSADAMDALGDVGTAVSDYASALRYYRVAAQRGHPDGYYKLGQTYERLGKKDEAVSAYYTYVTRRPDGRHAAAAKEAIRALEPRAKLPEPEAAPEADSQPAVEAKPEPKPAPPAETPNPESP